MTTAPAQYALRFVGLDVEHNRKRQRIRPRTISVKRLSKRALLEERARVAAELAADEYTPAPRPRTWGECQARGIGTAESPCAYVSCKFHLALDVSAQTGAIKVNAIDAIDSDGALDVRALPATCALHVAAMAGRTLDEIGDLLSLTRERVRQIETKGLRALAALSDVVALVDHLEDTRTPDHRPIGQIDTSETW